MTDGHRLAVEQLHAIQENALGTFEVVRVADEANANGWLHVTVSLNCSDGVRSATGVTLKRREWFTIGVPADFPYQVPSVWTSHVRFAGLPHVQWNRHLCLYQAPSTEWDVNDGMYGYITRLDLWLNHAALGQLNPTGEALHPPVAYVPDGPVRTVIPRADAPSVSESNWIGFATLANATEIRADIVGWKSLEEIGDEHPLAAAFLVSKAMPYEFPKKMSDLLPELERHGVPLRRVVTIMRLAVLLNQESEPLYVVLGTPMRGIAQPGARKYHLAAWYIDPVFVGGLRLSLNKFDANPKIRELGEDMERIVVDFLKTTDVQWCSVREDRPEIVVPRDRDSATAWFKGKAVAVWGCGALGSHIAEFLVRAGVRRLILRDKSLVAPGILARQLFSDADIGKSKVAALSQRLKSIRPSVEIHEFCTNLLSGPLSGGDWTDGADIVLETTGNDAVLTKLEAARKGSGPRTTVVSMALGHEAKNAMMLISGSTYSGGPLDIDRKLRLECCRRAELRCYKEEFWPSKPRSEVFQPEPGCSDATFMGSSADVALLAATLLNLAAQDLKNGDPVAVAHLVAQPSSEQSDFPSHKRFSWPVDQVFDDPHSGFEVRVTSAAWREMAGWINESDRVRGSDTETGGLLFGERNDLLKVIWADEISGPPPDSTRSSIGFICGIEGTAQLAKEKAERTSNLVRFLGMWHTHPGGLPIPSSTDLRGVSDLVEATGTKRGKSLMLIIGTGEDDSSTAAAYVFSSEDFEKIKAGGLTRPASIHLASGRDVVRNVGLALSGGGSRAIAFHLGCFRALHDRGLLDRVQVISAVSGGAVIAAMYAYGLGSFEDFDRSVVDLLKRGIQTDILKKLARPSMAMRAAGTVALAGAVAGMTDIARLGLSSASGVFRVRSKDISRITKNMQPPLRRLASSTTAFEEVLRDRLYGSTLVTAARRDDIPVVLNACELRSGSAFRFGSQESGCWRYGTVAGNAVRERLQPVHDSQRSVSAVWGRC